jgi:hypothetical protein
LFDLFLKPISLLANNFGEAYRYNDKKKNVISRYYERMRRKDPERFKQIEHKRGESLKAKIKQRLGIE